MKIIIIHEVKRYCSCLSLYFCKERYILIFLSFLLTAKLLRVGRHYTTTVLGRNMVQSTLRCFQPDMTKHSHVFQITEIHPALLIRNEIYYLPFASDVFDTD